MATKDHRGRPVVAVTGIGIVTSLGIGKDDNWKKLTSGQSGIHEITRFPTDGLRTKVAGTIDFIPADPLCAPALSEEFAMLASKEAIAESGVGKIGDFPGPLFVAVPPVEVEWPQRIEMSTASNSDTIGYDELIRMASTERFSPYYERFLYRGTTERLAEKLGTKGSPIALSTACASGASAIQLGVEAIQRGETDVALSIGTDGSVNTEALIRFALLSALSTSNEPPEGAPKPFSKNRDGFVMAEGAAALVLENLDHARARGAKILGVIAGCGEMADSFHRTRSSPDGKPIIGCITNALADAGITPADVDYINAHGTGTPENDKMEAKGVAAVLGERASGVPISSNKSMIGHTLSAAGAIEAAVTLLTIQNQRIPPTINYQVPDPEIAMDVVPNEARDAKVRYAISNSFGFGGQNVCLVIAGAP
ncbi:MAG TPA: beta-ketoacyl-ACP synthase [Xanthobacteraceae bacterium]|nr:beta-ketoacyl-ACP synthase [Xanthobacteraceae bacterium]